MTVQDVYVGMCEVRADRGAKVLRSTLGSCVGIGILWRQRRISALAHCLLPESATASEGPSAKYVTDAIPSLLGLLEATPQDHPQLVAVIAGGAFMMKHMPPATHGSIGELNTRMAQKLLNEAGIRIIHTEIGGNAGRQLSIHCDTQDYAVRTFDRIL
ncbi:chemotaxis protein CheD [Luteibacter sp. 9135]|uniref:chemotaxis protein CheD n=1 Tax=Luteibacter sp. 9135 TaxID=1500893 RepID=UPI0005662495|nr:chemotaxis protein CheD [Luteibacter sp. 9135]